MDPEEDGEEGTSDDERSRDWSIIKTRGAAVHLLFKEKEKPTTKLLWILTLILIFLFAFVSFKFLFCFVLVRD